MAMSRARVRRIVVCRRLKAIREYEESQRKFKRWAEANNIALCGHCGSALLDDGTCPGLCTPCERDR